MASKRGLLLLALVTVVVVIAAVMSRREDGPEPGQQTGAYLPDLLGRVNEVERVVIRTRGERVTLERGGGAWTVREKKGFPASTQRVRELVLGLARLQRIEPKTRNPDLYGKLGLRDVTEAGAQSTLVQLLGAGDAELATIVLGSRRASPVDPGKIGVYVRTPGDAQTWLVEGTIPAAGTALDWIDRALLDIAPARVRWLEIRHADGELLRLERAGPQAPDLALADLLPGEEPQPAFVVNDVANSLAGLRLDDVRLADQQDLSTAERSEIVMETQEGLRVEAAVSRVPEGALVLLSATAVPAREEGGGGAIAGDGHDEDVAAHARRLNGRWDGWLFLVDDEQLAKVLVRRKDLLQPAREPGGDVGPAQPVDPG